MFSPKCSGGKGLQRSKILLKISNAIERIKKLNNQYVYFSDDILFELISIREERNYYGAI